MKRAKRVRVEAERRPAGRLPTGRTAPADVVRADLLASLPRHPTSASLRQATVLQLQSHYGNAAVQRLLRPPPAAQRDLAEYGPPAPQVPLGAGAITGAIQGALEQLRLSGAHWTAIADLRGWGNSTSLDDLAEPFKSNMTAFIEALRAAGATVHIESTLRSRERAWLMHHAWRVAQGGRPPGDDPYGSGIIWDHGSRRATIAAAREMISPSGFNMAHIAALNSVHIRGLAIDMSMINVPEDWTFTHNGHTRTVRLGRPQTDQNPRLHRAGRTYFRVIKLVSDPPHWSHTGQ